MKQKSDENNIIALGHKKLSESTIIICGIVRNCARNLKRNIPIVNQLCDLSKNYHVVIFENDSVDNTKQILQDWKNSRENIHISVNDFNTVTIPAKHTSVNRFFSKARIDKMATYRNNYLEYIELNGLDADYVIVIDLDVRKIVINGIVSSFGIKQEWDAIAANGYIYSPSARFKKRFNDTYALVESGMENVPQTEVSISYNQYQWAFLRRNLPMIRVFSAFGGLAIYKYKAIQHCRYQTLTNDDERVEVRCEHFSIYKQMSEKGFDKVYINPNMRIKYQPYFFNKLFDILNGK